MNNIVVILTIRMQTQVLIRKCLNIRIKNQVLILKSLNIRLHNQFLILKCLIIKIKKQVIILKCQFQDPDMMEAHRRNQIMLGQWIQMSKILIKMIRIHGRPSTRQCMHLRLDRLNYYPNNFLITVKIIQMRHKKFQLISRRI